MSGKKKPRCALPHTLPYVIRTYRVGRGWIWECVRCGYDLGTAPSTEEKTDAG